MLSRLFKIPRINRFDPITSHQLAFRRLSNARTQELKPLQSIQHADNKKLCKNLFQRKEVFTPALLACIPSNEIKMGAVEKLLTAITEGDPSADIWHDSDCYLYLLHLMTVEKLPFWHGITAYAYVMALIQYTDKQPIKEIDKNTKLIREMKIDFLCIDNKLTVQGEKFIKYTCTELRKLGYIISAKELETFILSLPPIEQWLIKLPVINSKSHKNASHPEIILDILVKNMPFCRREENVDSPDYCWIPSSSIIHYVLNKISDKPVEMRPGFGKISVERIRKMHANNLHFVSLYGFDVNDNSIAIDGYLCGPFLAWLHDVGHVFWGSMLTFDERRFIFEQFLPVLDASLLAAKQSEDLNLINRIQFATFRAIDFNLTNIYFFAGSDRFIRYIGRTFSTDQHASLYPFERLEFQNIGRPVEDRFYFLFLKIRHELAPAENKIWDAILKAIQPTEFYRRNEITMAIEKLAYYAVNACNKPISTLEEFNELDCRVWLDIIDESKTSEQVWNEILKFHRESQFLQLISQGHLLFFQPYFPLSDEMRGAFKNSVEARVTELKLSKGDVVEKSKILSSW